MFYFAFVSLHAVLHCETAPCIIDILSQSPNKINATLLWEIHYHYTDRAHSRIHTHSWKNLKAFSSKCALFPYDRKKNVRMITFRRVYLMCFCCWPLHTPNTFKSNLTGPAREGELDTNKKHTHTIKLPLFCRFCSWFRLRRSFSTAQFRSSDNATFTTPTSFRNVMWNWMCCGAAVDPEAALAENGWISRNCNRNNG